MAPGATLAAATAFEWSPRSPAAHGGRFLVQQPAGGWTAILELPLADLPVGVAEPALAGSATRTEEHLAGAA